MSIHAARRDRLRKTFLEPGLDAFVVNSTVNVRYLTGFTGDSTYLVVTPTREYLVSDRRYTEQLAAECPGVPAEIRIQGDTTHQTLTKLLESVGARKIGFEANRMSVAECEKLKAGLATADWAATTGTVEKLRAVKDPTEVASILKAVQVAERVFAQFCVDLRYGDSEFDLTDRIEMLVRKCGGRATSFDPITAVAPRSALAHAPATDRRVEEGAWLLVDWGAVVDGYRSDLTRILVPNKPSTRSANAPALDVGRLETVYEAVRAARDRSIAALRPGVSAKDVDAAARAALEERGLLEYFSHSVGHGLGLETHEAPGLRSTSDEVLEAGMVVTIEPGLYFPEWGGVRIEDDLLITPNGAESLSSLPHDLASAYL